MPDPSDQQSQSPTGASQGQTQSGEQGGEQTQQQAQSQAQSEGETQPQAQQGTGPVGQGDHEVREGECISSIAKDTGHFWETIWNDPANSELKSTREDPNVLLPGDQVTIPELRRKEETGATEEHHRFRRLGEPARLRMRIVKEPQAQGQAEQTQAQPASDDPTAYVGGDPEETFEPQEDEPRANVPYHLVIDGEQTTGTTDNDGHIDVPIPGNARSGKLILNPGTEDEETIRVQLGSVHPITELTGVKQRLNNLTFECGEIDDEQTAELEAALRAFQAKHGLEATGEPDQATRDKLVEVHGS